MPRFPILSLPFLARVEVARHLELKDLVQFALISKKSAAIAKGTNQSFRTVAVIFNPLKNYQLILNYRLDGSYLNCIVPNGNHDTHGSDQTLTFPGVSQLETIQKLMACVFKIFKAEYVYLTAYEPFDITMLLKPNFPVGAFIGLHLKRTSDDSKHSTQKILFVLEELKPNSFGVQGEVEDGFTYFQPVENNIWIHGPRCWFDFEAAYNSTCEKMSILVFDAYTNEQLNRLFKKWARGEGSLGYFEMYTSASGEQEINKQMDEVLRGLGATPWNADKELRTYRGYGWESDNGRSFLNNIGEETQVFIEDHVFYFIFFQ